jgi:hypothetical protein
MGGFVVDTDDSGEEFIPGSPRLTITARGIILLAKTGHIPNLSKESILDKSKADNLAKSLVCVQAGWLLVEILDRLINKPPIGHSFGSQHSCSCLLCSCHVWVLVA